MQKNIQENYKIEQEIELKRIKSKLEEDLKNEYTTKLETELQQ